MFSGQSKWNAEALHSPPPVSVSVVPQKCGQLTFKKSSKIGATRRQISKFTKVLQSKSISAGALEPTGGAYRAPKLWSCI